MKERPILFSAPMVRALLDGSKTQTRRSLKGRGRIAVIQQSCGPMVLHDYDGYSGIPLSCPYGQPGDRLWVRETWANLALPGYPPCFVYRADGTHSEGDNEGCARTDGVKWNPSIFCKREASRIMLEITGIRVERVQDISEADASAEGLIFNSSRMGNWSFSGGKDWGSACDAYRELWQTINGPGSWYANPWVWVVEFKRVQP